MGLLRYVGGGDRDKVINISYSMNNGRSWQKRELRAGQSFPVPPDCTDLLLDNVPYNPAGNYEIRNGLVARK